MKFVLRSSQSSQVYSYCGMLTCGMASSLLTTVIAKKDSKSLDVNCRHSSVLTGMDRHKMSTAKKLFLRLVRVHNLYLANNDHQIWSEVQNTSDIRNTSSLVSSTIHPSTVHWVTFLHRSDGDVFLADSFILVAKAIY